MLSDKKTITESYDFEPTELIEGYFNIKNFNLDYFDDYEVYMWSWGNSGSKWSKDYSIQGDTVLVSEEFTSGIEGMLFALFEKGYIIENINVWDNNAVRQSTDIKGTILEEGFFDARRF